MAWLAVWGHGGSVSAQDAKSSAAASAPRTDIGPILEKYCFDCHGHGSNEGGLALDGVLQSTDPKSAHEKWVAVWKNLRAQTMPPSDEAQPTSEERTKIISWIERDVFKLDPANPDPGRVTIRRLNREEYRYTILDMLGVEFDVTEMFPADDTGYGFDTIGDVLSLSPLHLEKYLEAAQTIVAKAVTEKTPPEGSKDYPAAYRRVFLDGPPPADPAAREAYARKILEHFAGRAFRTPVDSATLDRLVQMAMTIDRRPNGKFEQGIAHSLTAILASPRFIFRAESQPEPNNSGQVIPLNEFAVASRLSYFLWRSLPDEELFRLAREGKLRANLRPQIDRMLADAKTERFVRSFVGQWMQTRDVESINVDVRRVLRMRRSEAERIFNHELRRSMRKETEQLFAHLLRENGSALDLLTADYTFLNEPLARWYGIEGVRGYEMQKVKLKPESHRGGILTHASFLLVTSNPTRTSPVKRGLFILENILGTPAAPPPANVPPLEDAAKGKPGELSARQLMELHRKDALCASCHARMDPLGLALEEYNALGQWRDKDNGQPIETAGQLITGEKFSNVQELAKVIATHRRQDFYRCLAEKLMTFAIGRGTEYYDSTSIDRMVADLERDGGKLRTLIYAIAESAPFQKRRGESDTLR